MVDLLGLCVDYPFSYRINDWVEEEFCRVEFYDDRLKARLYSLAADFHAQPGGCRQPATVSRDRFGRGMESLLAHDDRTG